MVILNRLAPGGQVLPAMTPHQPAARVLGRGDPGAAAFIAALLSHELAHSLAPQIWDRLYETKVRGPEEPYFWPVIWIRGNGGHWHATAHPRRHRLAGASADTTGQRDTHMIAASQRGFRPANRLTRRGRLP